MQLIRFVKAGRGEAPGKAIVLGEHFVVHGAPALAVPVQGRVVRVAASPEPGPWRCDPRATPWIEGMLRHLGLDPDAVRIEVDATLPVGAGLGSSAALAVALVRALGVEATPEVRRLAHELEKLAHGDPSGVDDTVAAYAAPVWFVRGAAPVPIDAAARLPLWVALTPAGPPTSEAVARVASWRAAAPGRFADIIASAQQIAEAGRVALATGDWAALGRLMSRAQAHLREVGVSTPLLDALCERAVREGAWGAKLTGSGLGGAMIALAPVGVDLDGPLSEAGASEVFRA